MQEYYEKKYPLKNNFLGFNSKTAVPILATRGCPYSCFNYCTYPLQQGRKVRYRSVKNIINHFMSRPQEVLKFLPKLVESKILIATFANVNLNGIQGVIKIKIIFVLYYITLFTWFNDENESLEKTMRVLDKYLNNIEKVIKFA